MKYLRLTTTDPYYNLALEEYLFRHTREDVFLLWQNESTVVIGKNQNAYAEISLLLAKERGIRISRRITGGGAVYHDLGNLNYSFITSRENADVLDYARFAEPILHALSALGLSCSLSGRNDLEYNGRKFSGNAQYAADGRILHHGTILFNADLSVLSEVLRVDKEKLAYRAVKSTASRVVNLSEFLGDMDVGTFIGHIERHVLADTGATPLDLPSDPRIEALRLRNESPEWIFSDRRYLTDYTVFRKRKFPFGLVEIEMNLSEDRIDDIRISGDFFGTAPIEALESSLRSLSLHSLPPISPAPYISGMTKEELRELLVGEP